MALDIVRDARDKKVDSIFLFSNDTDLLDAIKDAQLHEAKIYHCVFKDCSGGKYSTNYALSKHSDFRLVLNNQLIKSLRN